MSKCHITIDKDVCKGCKVCVKACPKKCIIIGKEINKMGYQFAKPDDKDCCIACGICFYVCPEPFTITVYKEDGDITK